MMLPDKQQPMKRSALSITNFLNSLGPRKAFISFFSETNCTKKIVRKNVSQLSAPNVAILQVRTFPSVALSAKTKLP